MHPKFILIASLTALALTGCATTSSPSNVWHGTEEVVATGTCKSTEPKRNVSYRINFADDGTVTAARLQQPNIVLAGTIFGDKLQLTHPNGTTCPNSPRRESIFTTTGSVHGAGSDRTIELSTDSPLCPEIGCTFKVITVLRPSQ